MLRDVRTTVTDGGLGLDKTKGEGVHLKIGVSPIVSDDPIVITGNMSAQKIKERLGLSPLADACMDSVENGANMIYCIPVAAAVDGTIGTIEKTVTGTGSCVVSGKPNNAFSISIKITGAGGFNAAALKYSLDGGYSYSDEMTMPLLGEVTIPNTGLKFKFTEGATPADSFKVGDVYSVKTEAPQMINQDVITAIGKLKFLTEDYEWVHVVGESTKDLWYAVATQQKTLADTYHKPLFFVLEARKKQANETVDDYAIALSKEKKDIQNYDIQVVAARSIYTRMDNTTREINNAGIVCGWYAQAAVQQSIGETKTFSISEKKMLQLMPKGIEQYLSLLDDSNYLTFRKYDGLSGFYVTNARMMCPENSDYRYAEDSRVKNKIIRQTRKQALTELQVDVDMTDVQGSLEAIAKFIEIPLDKMARKKEISKARIVVPEGQDILVTETMYVKIRFVPIGHIREIEIDLGMENPLNTSA